MRRSYLKLFVPMLAIAACLVPALSTTAVAAGGRDAKGRYLPNAKPTGPSVDFALPADAKSLPSLGIFSMLFIGSDARPKQPLDRTRGDSLHVFTFNPKTKRGALLGIPRDTYTSLPGGRKGKITGALAMGGPQGMMQAVRTLTGIPVQHYVVTGFAGFTGMVDQLGGVTIEVPPMNDKYSGAQFAGGWYSFNGKAALAFSRNRHDLKNGDFGRSLNQGRMLLAMLAKMRSETSKPEELQKWIQVFYANGKTDMTPLEMLDLAVIARQIDPSQIANVVLPGKVGTAGKASVVFALPGPLLGNLRTTGEP
jgi:polyisoprenyl-teichoic acid--peptidoglycan teichoic acid transferase